MQDRDHATFHHLSDTLVYAVTEGAYTAVQINNAMRLTTQCARI